MTTGQLVLLLSVLLVVAVGAHRAYADGRFSGTHRVRGVETEAPDSPADPVVGPRGVLEGHPRSADLGQRATLLQFSSAFCAPCRATRRVLGDVAAQVPGVVHLELDAEHELALVRRLGILRTPTTLVLDPRGREVSRASGAPRPEQVLAALGAAVG